MTSELIKPILELVVQETLSDYIVAIAWSPVGNTVAVAAGDGEIRLLKDFAPMSLCPPTGESIDAIGFSSDGQWLAAGGQDGVVKLWQMDSEIPIVVDAIKCSSWIDRLVWNPACNQLAFNQGKTVQIWDADHGESVIVLEGSSAPQDIRWSPDGRHLAIATQSNVHIWNAQNWNAPRYQWELMSPASSIAWSADSAHIACAIHDHSVGVMDWSSVQHFQEQPTDDRALPILLQGFPGKIRRLAWSDFPDSTDLPPVLAAATRELVTMWMPARDDVESWALDLHEANVLDVAFQPKSGLLASLSEDGWIILWQAAVEAAQVIEGPKSGLSCLAWDPQGQHLAAGGQQGEFSIWSMPIS
jgi:dipeptidyl aminopeptidase/acylaminoacyl peptidase